MQSLIDDDRRIGHVSSSIVCCPVSLGIKVAAMEIPKMIITRGRRERSMVRGKVRVIGQSFKALEDGTFDRPVWACIYASKAEVRSRNLAHRLIRRSSAF